MIDVLDTARVAHASLRGYLFQIVLGVQRWLTLRDAEVLLVEGDEDLDVIFQGGRTAEQVKNVSGTLNVRDAPVRDSLRNFVAAYVTRRQRGESERFVFATTAQRRTQRTNDLPVDVMQEWHNAERRNDVIAAVRSIVGPTDAVAWLDATPTHWTDLLAAVEWRFGVPELAPTWITVTNSLRQDERTQHLPADLLFERLLAELLQASTEEKAVLRARTRQQLDAVIVRTDAELRAWAQTSAAQQIRTVVNEVRNLDRLLQSGTRSPAAQQRTPGQLLTAAYEVIRFDDSGRATELSDLAEWCNGPLGASAWLWTGPGGSGKTRLCIEWCRRLERQGWHAGFLKNSVLPEQLDALVDGIAPRLIVIDYAERRDAICKRLLQLLAEHAEKTKPRVRVLLLARRSGDWWEHFRRDAQVRDLLEGSPPPRPVQPLGTSVQDRIRLFLDAVDGFAHAQNKGVSTSPNTDGLEDPTYDHILFVHMAALAAVEGAHLRGSNALLKHTLDREEQFWQPAGIPDTLKSDVESAVRDTVAALVLVGRAVAINPAIRLVQRVTDLERLRPELPGYIVRHLMQIYGHDLEGSLLLPLQPDLLGEYLTARVLIRWEQREPLRNGHHSFLDRLLERATDDEVKSAFTILGRIASGRLAKNEDAARWLAAMLRDRLSDRALVAMQVAIELGASTDPTRLGVVLANELEAHGTADLAERVLPYCPERTISLREVCTWAVLQVLTKREDAWDTPTDEQKSELAHLHIQASNRLSEVGRREEALQAAEKALRLFSELDERSPDFFQPGIAVSLNNLAGRLSDLGSSSEALRVMQRATTLFRNLADKRPDIFQPDLALGLNNLGAFLGVSGQPEAALTAALESVAIRRELCAAQRERFESDLAASLISLSTRLADLGRTGEGLVAAREAEAIFRKLAQKRPDAFRSELAISLNNVSVLLGAMGDHSNALATCTEALVIWEDLSATRPGVFRPQLATSLMNLGNRLSHLGRNTEALETIRGATEILKSLAKSWPEAYGLESAKSTFNLGLAFYREGRWEEAAATASEAVQTYLRMGSRLTGTIRAELAHSLGSFATALSASGRSSESLSFTRQAVELYRGLAAERPAMFNRDLAAELANLGSTLAETGQWRESLLPLHEAISLQRTLVVESNAAVGPQLAGSLVTLGTSLMRLNEPQEGLKATAEGVSILRNTINAGREELTAQLSEALNNMGNDLGRMSRWSEASEALNEAIAIRRRLAHQQPAVFAPRLARSLGNLAQVLLVMNRASEAIEATRESMSTLEPHFRDSPNVFRELMTRIVQIHLYVTSTVGVEPASDLVDPILDMLKANPQP